MKALILRLALPVLLVSFAVTAHPTAAKAEVWGSCVTRGGCITFLHPLHPASAHGRGHGRHLGLVHR